MIVNSRLDQMCMHNIPPEHPEKFKDIKESNQSLKIPKRVIWQDHGQYNDIKWSTKHYTETKKWPMLNLLTQGMKSGIKRKRKQTKKTTTTTTDNLYWSAWTKPVKWTVMYLCDRGINFASFFDFDIWLCSCSASMVFFCFFILFHMFQALVALVHFGYPV